jgi:uncharacterized protein YndB with AHSA1/START domain
MQDVIQQSLFLAAPRERVWRAISEPKELAGWFSSLGIEGDLVPGNDIVFCFEMSPSAKEDGRCRARVVALEPNKRFAYRWRPGTCSVAEVTDLTSTLVELILTDEKDGTIITIRESGFASLSDGETAYGDNNAGWADCLASLEKFAESWTKQPSA